MSIFDLNWKSKLPAILVTNRVIIYANRERDDLSLAMNSAMDRRMTPHDRGSPK